MFYSSSSARGIEQSRGRDPYILQIVMIRSVTIKSNSCNVVRRLDKDQKGFNWKTA